METFPQIFTMIFHHRSSKPTTEPPVPVPLPPSHVATHHPPPRQASDGAAPLRWSSVPSESVGTKRRNGAPNDQRLGLGWFQGKLVVKFFQGGFRITPIYTPKKAIWKGTTQLRAMVSWEIYGWYTPPMPRFPPQEVAGAFLRGLFLTIVVP